MRHFVAIVSLLGVLLLGAIALDALAARSRSAGHVWVVTRGAPGPAIAGVLSSTGGTLLRAWFGGRVLVLDVASLAAAAPPAPAAWITFRMVPTVAGIAGCG